MLATICDDPCNVLNMQPITPNLERWDYSDIPSGGHKKIKGPAHMVEGGHHLRKAPTSTKLLCGESPQLACCQQAFSMTNSHGRGVLLYHWPSLRRILQASMLSRLRTTNSQGNGSFHLTDFSVWRTCYR